MSSAPVPETVTPASSAWSRFRNRLRFGLTMQEALDRLARFGVVIYPYYFVDEPVRPRMELERPEGLEFRRIDPGAAHLLAHLPERPRDEEKIRSVMAFATCIAALEHDEIVAYSWYTQHHLKGVAGLDPIAPLPPDCAYLFDMFVCRRARGRQVAAQLRNHVHGLLSAKGVRHTISVSLLFNRSTRKFKAKLGAVETELRILLRIKPFPGLDVRLHRKPWLLDTPIVHIARTEAAS
jgi:GNAT superfamily N-acetyltransferase